MAKENNTDEGWIDASDNAGTAWDQKKPIMGTLKAKREKVGPNGSNMYMLEVEGEEGLIGVWGSTVLDTKFEQIPVGSMVKVEFVGMTKSEKTGREFKNYKVMYKPPQVPPGIEETFPGSEVV